MPSLDSFRSTDHEDPDDRWQDASDLRDELRWIAEGGVRAVARGRSYVNDGYAHVFDFDVNGKTSGDDLALTQRSFTSNRREEHPASPSFALLRGSNQSGNANTNIVPAPVPTTYCLPPTA